MSQSPRNTRGSAIAAEPLFYAYRHAPHAVCGIVGENITIVFSLYIRLTDAMCNGEQAEADTYILQIMKIASEYLERVLSERNK